MASADQNPVITSTYHAKPWDEWSVMDVKNRLSASGLPEEESEKFSVHEIKGNKLHTITMKYIKETLIISEQYHERIYKFLKDLEETDKLSPIGSKLFNDPVHGHMELHPLCVAIIDTPQFQRLRYLKQLGAGYFVYPGASHNRFEHSLGVCHLAGQLVKSLQSRQPELGITNQDILCVEIAGLCHDLGHGPFSHIFDRKFIPSVDPSSKWKHEDASQKMFDDMVEKNDGLENKFDKYWINKDRREFIKELIIGFDPADNETGDEQQEVTSAGTADPEKPTTNIEGEKAETASTNGASIAVTTGSQSETTHTTPVHSSAKLKLFYGPKSDNPDKAFLYEVVANKRNEVDVDKWDYFKRDCHHLGMSCGFDHMRFIHLARVCKDEKGHPQICVRDKEVFNMYEMFQTRYSLHRRAYQHRVVQGAELLLVEALKEANQHIRIPGDDRKGYSLFKCVNQMPAYSKLTDAIFHHILDWNDDPTLRGARKILQDFQKHKYYKCVGETDPITDVTILEKKQEDIRTEILEEIPQHDQRRELDDTKFVVEFAKLDFGKKDKNPVDSIMFYSKEDMNKAISMRNLKVSNLLPQGVFREHLVRVFLRPTGVKHDDEQRCTLLHNAFESWCLQNNLQFKTMPMDSSTTDE